MARTKVETVDMHVRFPVELHKKMLEWKEKMGLPLQNLVVISVNNELDKRKK